MGQVRMVLVKDFLGHAIVAAEVAAVRYADAQVAQLASPRVAEQTVGGNQVGRLLPSLRYCKGTGACFDERNDFGTETFGHGRYCPTLVQSGYCARAKKSPLVRAFPAW